MISRNSLFSRVEFSVLLAGLAVAGAAWGFFVLASEVREGELHALDTDLLLALRTPGQLDNPIGPQWLEIAMRDLTSLGSAVVLVMLTAIVVIFLLATRRFAMAALALVAIAGGQALSSLLKFGLDRSRPDIVPHLVEVTTQSFPSGHAMMSAITYLTLGAMLARAQPSNRMKAYFLSVAILITFLVGISRVYLGVHWPTDVLAGWCAGFAWAMVCWLLVRRFMRGETHRTPPEP